MYCNTNILLPVATHGHDPSRGKNLYRELETAHEVLPLPPDACGASRGGRRENFSEVPPFPSIEASLISSAT
jgi:hypothetical protein